MLQRFSPEIGSARSSWSSGDTWTSISYTYRLYVLRVTMTLMTNWDHHFSLSAWTDWKTSSKWYSILFRTLVKLLRLYLWNDNSRSVEDYRVHRCDKCGVCFAHTPSVPMSCSVSAIIHNNLTSNSSFMCSSTAFRRIWRPTWICMRFDYCNGQCYNKW